VKLKASMERFPRHKMPYSKLYYTYVIIGGSLFYLIVVFVLNMCICMKCRTLDKTISNLEMELAAAKAAQESIRSGAPVPANAKMSESSGKRRYLMVVGINTAFSSRKRRDSVRETWMPQGSYLHDFSSFLPSYFLLVFFFSTFLPSVSYNVFL